MNTYVIFIGDFSQKSLVISGSFVKWESSFLAGAHVCERVRERMCTE